MALTLVESAVLWGVPILTILVSLGYYFYWGKEAQEVQDEGIEETGTASNRGDV